MIELPISEDVNLEPTYVYEQRVHVAGSQGIPAFEREPGHFREYSPELGMCYYETDSYQQFMSRVDACDWEIADAQWRERNVDWIEEERSNQDEEQDLYEWWRENGPWP